MLHLQFPQLFLFPAELIFLESSSLVGDFFGADVLLIRAEEWGNDE
jgi:hypothetical protein